MTIENTETQLTAADEFAIQATANEMIKRAAVKGGYSVAEIPEEAKLDAMNFARNAYVEEQSRKANPLYAQLEAEREDHRLTKMQMDAIKQTRPTVSSNVPTGPDPRVIRAQLGEGDWRALTDSGRLQACGINPNTVTPLDRSEAKKAFGRGPDTHFASNLAKQDWARYKYLKNVAIIENYQGQ